MFPKEVIAQLQIMKKNDLATLKCKYNDLLEQPKNENTNGEPLIN